MSDSSTKEKYSDLIQNLIPILQKKDHEGLVLYMYLDTQGHLTIGTGHLMLRHESFSSRAAVRAAIESVFDYGFKTIDDPAATSQLLSTSFSGRLPMLDKNNIGSFEAANSTPVLSDEIDRPGIWGADLKVVESYLWSPTVDALVDDAVKIDRTTKSFNYIAEHYKKLNRYELTETGAAALLFDDIVRRIPDAERAWNGFEDFPQPAQLALMDILHQGKPGVMNVNVKHSQDAQSFEKNAGPAATKFTAAVVKQDFKQAAELVPSLRTTWYADNWTGSADGKQSARTAWRIAQFKAADKLVNIGTYLKTDVYSKDFPSTKPNLHLPNLDLGAR